MTPQARAVSICVLLLMSASVNGRLRAQAVVDESRVSVTINVSPQGSDDNDGSDAHPVQSIYHAWNVAKNHLAEGTSTRIYLHEGTYELRQDRKMTVDLDGPVFVIEGVDRATVTIRGAGVEKQFFYFGSGSNVVFRNIRFTNSPRGFIRLGTFGRIQHNRNWLIEECDFEHNGQVDANFDAVTLDHAVGFTIRNSTFNNNRGRGIYLIGRNGLVEDVEVAYNCAGRTQKFPGGLHAIGDSILFRRVNVHHNTGDGLHNDLCATRFHFEDCRFNHNTEVGFKYEIAWGPITAVNCEMIGNQDGVRLATVYDATLRGCRIIDNHRAAICITWRDRTVLHGEPLFWSNAATGDLLLPVDSNWLGVKPMYGTKNTVVKNCVIGGSLDTSMLYMKNPTNTTPDDYETWYTEELHADSNVYYHTAKSHAFEIRQKERVTFSQWRTISGEDAHSQWRDDAVALWRGSPRGTTPLRGARMSPTVAVMGGEARGMRTPAAGRMFALDGAALRRVVTPASGLFVLRPSRPAH